jgi:hypothetical protein
MLTGSILKPKMTVYKSAVCADCQNTFVSFNNTHCVTCQRVMCLPCFEASPAFPCYDTLKCRGCRVPNTIKLTKK